LNEILAVDLRDDCAVWHLNPDGTWRFSGQSNRRHAHKMLQELALARSQVHGEAAG
jgi:hypothetical protein